MTWVLRWHAVARRDLANLPMRTAERMDAAVIRFAATGLGDARWQPAPDGDRRAVLSVPGAVALLYLDAKARTIVVNRVFPRAQ